MLSTFLLFLFFWKIVEAEILDCNGRLEVDLEKPENNPFSLKGELKSNQKCSWLILVPDKHFFRLNLAVNGIGDDDTFEVIGSDTIRKVDALNNINSSYTLGGRTAVISITTGPLTIMSVMGISVSYGEISLDDQPPTIHTVSSGEEGLVLPLSSITNSPQKIQTDSEKGRVILAAISPPDYNNREQFMNFLIYEDNHFRGSLHETLNKPYISQGGEVLIYYTGSDVVFSTSRLLVNHFQNFENFSSVQFSWTYTEDEDTYALPMTRTLDARGGPAILVVGQADNAFFGPSYLVNITFNIEGNYTPNLTVQAGMNPAFQHTLLASYSNDRSADFIPQVFPGLFKTFILTAGRATLTLTQNPLEIVLFDGMEGFIMTPNYPFANLSVSYTGEVQLESYSDVSYLLEQTQTLGDLNCTVSIGSRNQSVLEELKEEGTNFTLSLSCPPDSTGALLRYRATQINANSKSSGTTPPGSTTEGTYPITTNFGTVASSTPVTGTSVSSSGPDSSDTTDLSTIPSDGGSGTEETSLSGTIGTSKSSSISASTSVAIFPTTTSEATTTTEIPVTEDDCSQPDIAVDNISYKIPYSVQFRAKTSCIYRITVPDNYAVGLDLHVQNLGRNETVILRSVERGDEYPSANGSLNVYTLFPAGKIEIVTTVNNDTINIINLEIQLSPLSVGVMSATTSYEISNGEPAIVLDTEYHLQVNKTCVIRSSSRVHITAALGRFDFKDELSNLVVFEGGPGATKIFWSLLQFVALDGFYDSENSSVTIYHVPIDRNYSGLSKFIFNDYGNVEGFKITQDSSGHAPEIVHLDATDGPVAMVFLETSESVYTSAILREITFGNTSGQTLTVHATAPISQDTYKIASYTPSSPLRNLLPLLIPTPIKTFVLDSGKANLTFTKDVHIGWYEQSAIGRHAVVVSRYYMNPSTWVTLDERTFTAAPYSPYLQYTVRTVRGYCGGRYRLGTSSGSITLERNSSVTEEVFSAMSLYVDSGSCGANTNGSLLTVDIDIQKYGCSELNITFNEATPIVKHFRAVANCTYRFTVPDGYVADLSLSAHYFSSAESIALKVDGEVPQASSSGFLVVNTVIVPGNIVLETKVSANTENLVMLEIRPIKMYVGQTNATTYYNVSNGEPAKLFTNAMPLYSTQVLRFTSKVSLLRELNGLTFPAHISANFDPTAEMAFLGLLISEGEPETKQNWRPLYKMIGSDGTYLSNHSTITVYKAKIYPYYDYSSFIFNDYDNVKNYKNIPGDWKIDYPENLGRKSYVLDATNGPVAKVMVDIRFANVLLENISFGSSSNQTLTIHGTAPISKDTYKIASYTPTSSLGDVLPQNLPTLIRTIVLDRGVANISLRYMNYEDWSVESLIGRQVALATQNYMQPFAENTTVAVPNVIFKPATHSPYLQYSVKLVRADPSCYIRYSMETASGLVVMTKNGSEITQVFPSVKNLTIGFASQGNGALLIVDIMQSNDTVGAEDCSNNQTLLNTTTSYSRTFQLVSNCTLTFIVPDGYSAFVDLHASSFGVTESFKAHNEKDFSLAAANGSLSYEAVFPGSKIVLEATVMTNTSNIIGLTISLSLKAVGAKTTNLAVTDGEPGLVLDMVDSLRPMETYVIRTSTKVHISAAFYPGDSLDAANNLFLYEGEPKATESYETLYKLLANGQTYTSKGSVVTVYNSMSTSATAKANPSRFIFNELENVKNYKSMSTVWPPTTSTVPLQKAVSMDASQGPVSVTYLDQREKHVNMQLKAVKFTVNGTHTLSVYSTAPMSKETYAIASFSSTSSLDNVLPLDLPTFTRTFVLDSGTAELTLVFQNPNPVWKETSMIGRSLIVTTPNYMNPVSNCSTYTLSLERSNDTTFQYDVRVLKADPTFSYSYSSDSRSGPVLNRASTQNRELLTSKNLSLILYPGNAESQGAILSVDIREVATRGGSTALLTGLLIFVIHILC